MAALALALALAYNLDLSLDFRINIDHLGGARRCGSGWGCGYGGFLHFCVLVDA